MKVTSLWTFHL